ncbi:hypothetical protein PI125_g5531 [Phytophthora idaei]|nr:hypothetical protein PI125_g5531 [Phytophthora idaei]
MRLFHSVLLATVFLACIDSADTSKMTGADVSAAVCVSSNKATLR